MASGLLGDAFVGVQRHLAAVAAGASTHPGGTAASSLQRSATGLLPLLLQYAERLGVAHAALRMPLDAPQERVSGGAVPVQCCGMRT